MILQLLQKCAFFDEMTNVQQENSWNMLNEFVPGTDPDNMNDGLDETYPHSIDFDRGAYKDTLSNVQRDGHLFREIAEFRRKRKDRLNKIRKMRRNLKENRDKLKEMKRDDGNLGFSPTPYYSSAYGYTGLEGTMEFPLEYYSGALTNEPGSITNNPYNTIYQSATERAIRRKIRAIIGPDLIK
jgi:hypothetical protein